MQENEQVPEKLKNELDKLEAAILEAAERLKNASEDIADKVLALQSGMAELLTPPAARKQLRAVEGELKALRKSSKRQFATLEKSASKQAKTLAKTSRRVTKILTKGNGEAQTPKAEKPKAEKAKAEKPAAAPKAAATGSNSEQPAAAPKAAAPVRSAAARKRPATARRRRAKASPPPG